MKRLILMRHAKSDWSAGLSSDHDRPLNARGHQNAILLGVWLKEKGLRPDTVLCSTATRAVETLKNLGLDSTVDVKFIRDLYLAAPEQIMAQVQQATGETVLLIGHNPGIAAMAEMIVKTPPNRDGISHYPTGATLAVTFDVDDWSDIDWRMGKMSQIVGPRDLSAPE
jgi:phosphohistidine phosphatase